MNSIDIKPTHTIIKVFYKEISVLCDHGQYHEGAVKPAFANLLRAYGRKLNLSLSEEYHIKKNDTYISVDGALLNAFKLPVAYWEAKDTKDDLPKEVTKKFDKGYPVDNIIFQAPDRAILWQDGQEIMDADIADPKNLVKILTAFFDYQPPAIEQWGKAVEEFKEKVPELANGLLDLIETERKENKKFVQAFEDFSTHCRESINPNISTDAIEEMLIQHMLTERIFRTVFNNPDFAHHNVIAHEIEKVIHALTSRNMSRHDFVKPLDRFYKAIEMTAATIGDFSEKQSFLNTVYEQFFQGYSVKVADTHGIVYTPQPIVNFMVKSIEEILQKEFNRSLSDKGVHILDPFVGTGNFILRVMREIKKTSLEHKFKNELHCNEVMLLPYYIASMNIEHEHFDLTGSYEPFDGICMVDTFELAEAKDSGDLFMSQENTKRVNKQRNTPIFVILGNPPYNSGQVNENDNNKNRKYKTMDKRIKETYGKESKATLLRKLYDPYIKAIRWASDKINKNGEGVVSFVTNYSFIHKATFDSMRKCLADDFDTLYLLDLGGELREGAGVSDSNVFGITPGVSINIFIKNKNSQRKQTRIFYHRTPADWKKGKKFDFLSENQACYNVTWKEIFPDKNNTWLTDGLRTEYDKFVPLGTKEAKKAKNQATNAIFKMFSLGVATNRDAVVYDFNNNKLENRVKQFCEDYNSEVARFLRKGNASEIDDFVNYDNIKWSSTLKNHTKRGTYSDYNNSKIRCSIYRPFTKMFLFYDKIFNDRPSHFQEIFSTLANESENKVICVPGVGNRRPFGCMVMARITSLDFAFEKAQCFPFYTYNEDGSNRQENITDWALEQFRTQYEDKKITKWDIFYYIYGLLHHPEYREKYAANLRHELPRLPFAPDFKAFATAGKKLADLHVNYEDQPEYKLNFIENEKRTLDWNVEKMRLSKDKASIKYNDFLTLDGIPEEVFEYRLGNRSALEWIIDQYQVKVDQRSGIKNDPNTYSDDPQYIVKLIGKIITVSLETVKIVNALPRIIE